MSLGNPDFRTQKCQLGNFTLDKPDKDLILIVVKKMHDTYSNNHLFKKNIIVVSQTTSVHATGRRLETAGTNYRIEYQKLALDQGGFKIIRWWTLVHFDN